MAESVVSDEALADEASSDPGSAEAVSTGDAATGSLDLTDPAALRSALEALLFVADAPVQLSQLAAAVQRPAAEVAQALAEITADLDRRDAGWQLRPAATGFRLYTRDRYAPVVEAFLLDGQRSQAQPGRAGDAGRGGLPAAGHPGPDLGDPRRQRRRGGAHPAGPGTDHRGGARTPRPVAACTAPPAPSWRRWASPRWTSCPRWRRCCPSWTPWIWMSCDVVDEMERC